MSRFAALDLTTLPAPSAVVELDYDAILEARLVELEARLKEKLPAEKVSEIMALARNIAASPMRYLNEAAAARELYLANRINEAVRSVFLATARGGDLDLIGANRGVVRRVLDGTDPENVIVEGDEAFRARIQLVIEAWSPHGTEGSYVYWALDADDRVADVVIYGPNHNVVPAVPPGEPKMVILSREGDGTAAPDLLQVVFDHCATDTRRPVGDLLTVVSAAPVPYQIEATLHVTSAASVPSVEAAAIAAAQAYIAGRIKIARKVYRSSIAAALMVDGVVDVELSQPASDVEIGSFEAGFCSSMSVTVQTVTGGWRDV